MSTTAGLGSGEYVAVNGTAVFALLLGLASALSLLDPLLLILPLTGIIVAVMALRQIIQSNGTQTGRGLVMLGLLLILGFGGWSATGKVREEIRTREDRVAIQNLVTEVADKSKAADDQGLYALFSGRFHDRVKFPEFSERIKYLRQSLVYGKLKGANTGLMVFDKDESTGTQYAQVHVAFDFEKTDHPLPDDLTLKKEGDHWRIETFTTLFPPPASH